jgi:hypothetical protein
MCTKHQYPWDHKPNTSERKATERSRYTNSRSQFPTFINRQNIQTEIKNDILELNKTTDEMDLTYIYRVFHPMGTDYTFLSASHGTFSKIGHILCH